VFLRTALAAAVMVAAMLGTLIVVPLALVLVFHGSVATALMVVLTTTAAILVSYLICNRVAEPKKVLLYFAALWGSCLYIPALWRGDHLTANDFLGYAMVLGGATVGFLSRKPRKTEGVFRWFTIGSAVLGGVSALGIVAIVVSPLLRDRVISHRRSGFDARIQEYDQDIQLNPNDAVAFENRCVARAEANLALEAALSDCNESLRIMPNNEYTLDSRGFVYFRMGQYEKAIADFDAALKKNPRLTGSVYLRGVSKRRKGDTAGGDADIAAANALDPKLSDVYAHYGVTP
jgi:hypothetical protein